MGAVPDDISHLFPLRVRLRGDDPRPRLLYIAGDPKDEIIEDEDPDDGITTANDDHTRRISPTAGAFWERLSEPTEDDRPIIQQVPWRREYGAKAHGRSGCITRLKRALETMRGGKWSNSRLIDEMEKSGRQFASSSAVARQIQRLEAGEERVDAELVVQIARAFGVELDDLVFTHEVNLQKDSAAQRNPIAALIDERNAKYHAALRRYEVALAPLGDDESYSRLAKDIADPAIEKRWRHPFRTDVDDVPRDRWPEALKRLQELLTDRNAPVDRLAAELKEVAVALHKYNLRVRVGRYIRVVGLVGEYPLPPPGEPVRRVTVVVSSNPEDTNVHVDLRTSWRNRPSSREQRLDEGDVSVVAEIKRDIAWCGHWEGRWFGVLPLDAPDWLEQAAKQRTGV